MRPLATAAFALALLAAAPHALAAEGAEQLFERGVKEFLAGNFQIGCPLIEQSYELDPLPGVLFTLAECQLGWGKAKTAADNYGRFLDTVQRLPAAEASKHAERTAVAIKKRAEAIERIASLTVRVSGKRAPGTRLLLGARDVTALLGKRIELDPGTHSVVLAARGHPNVERQVTLAAGSSEELELELAPPVPSAPPKAKSEKVHEAPPSEGKPAAAWILGGVGVTGVVVGSVTGLMAQSKKGSIEDNCPNRVCNAEGREAVDSGQRWATVSTVSFGVGIVALGAATYLLLQPGKTSAPTGGAGPRVSFALGTRPSLAFSTPF